MSNFRSNNRDGGGCKKFCCMAPLERVHKTYIEMLDYIEAKAEALRESASAIEMERESLIMSLGRIKNHTDLKRFSEADREEIDVTAQRLLNRMLTVEINVITARNEVQKKALTKVNKMVDDLLIVVKADRITSRKIIEQYVNACLSESIGPINIKFQTLLLDCTADDQKSVRKRLETIMNSTFHADILMDID